MIRHKQLEITMGLLWRPYRLPSSWKNYPISTILFVHKQQFDFLICLFWFNMIKGSNRRKILYLLLFVWSLWISESWMSIHNSIVHECLHQSFIWCSYDFGNFICEWILYTVRIHPRAKFLIQTSILLSLQFAYCNAYPIISIIELLSYSLSSPSLLRSSISLSDLSLLSMLGIRPIWIESEVELSSDW